MSTHLEHGTRVRVKTIAKLNVLILDFTRLVKSYAR